MFVLKCKQNNVVNSWNRNVLKLATKGNHLIWLS